MLLAHKWAWEALLASDQANDATVEQIEKAIQEALENGEEVQPELRARVEIHWLKRATDTAQGLEPRVISALQKLSQLVYEHGHGASRFDESIEFPDLLKPNAELALRVGFVLVLKGIQDIDYPGRAQFTSHGRAFEAHCFMWQVAGDYGKELKGHFDKLMEEDTTAGSAHLPRLARQLAAKTKLTSVKVLAELRDYVEAADDALGPAFLQKLAEYAAPDDLAGYSILEQLGDQPAGRPRKRRRLSANEGGPLVANTDLMSPEGLGGARSPAGMRQDQIMDDASAQRLNERVREREAFADVDLYPDPAPVGAGGTVLGTPARARVTTPGMGGAGPSQPRQGRTLEWVDTPGDVPDPMESPTRRAYRPPSYQSPEGPSEPKGRRPTVKWTPQEVARLHQLVRHYGRGAWAPMIQSLEPGELLLRRSQVDLKDKWRNMCKADPTLEEVGKRNGNQAGPHGTPAALRLPPDEQVDENAPPGVGGVAGNAALHSGNGAPAAADDGDGGAVAATGGADGEDDMFVAEPAADEPGTAAAEGATAEGATAEGAVAPDPAADTAGQPAAADAVEQAAAE